MRISISKAVFLSVVLAAVASGTRASAGVDHAMTNVFGQGNGIGDHIQTGEFYATSQAGNSIVGGVATVQGIPGTSSLYLTGSSINDFIQPIFTDAVWNDTLSVSGPAESDLPDYVYLYFHASGFIGGIGAYGGTLQFGNHGTDVSYSVYEYSNLAINDISNPGFWDSVQYSDGYIEGYWHQKVGLAGPDAFGNRSGVWGVEYLTEGATAFGSGFITTINESGSSIFSLEAARLEDGRTLEEAGLSLTFGSGLTSPNLRPVPEPSSIVMIASGAIGLLGYGWRRRAKTSA